MIPCILAAIISISQSGGWTELGVTKVGDMEVPVRIWRDDAPFDRVVPIAGRSYAIGQNQIVDAGFDGLTDSQAKELYEAGRPKSQALPWRVKVIILSGLSVVEVAPTGSARSRFGSIDARQMALLHEQLAAFQAMAETRSEGSAKIMVDLEIDETPYRLKLDSSGLDEPGVDRSVSPKDGYPSPSWLRKFIAPRVNQGPFESDDGKYRGPFDSRWVIHSSPIRRDGTLEDGSGVIQCFSWFRPDVWTTPDGFARNLLERWEADVAIRSRRLGRHVGDRERWTPASVWPLLSASRLVERQTDPDYYRPREKVSLADATALDLFIGTLPVPSKDGSKFKAEALPALAALVSDPTVLKVHANRDGALEVTPAPTGLASLFAARGSQSTSVERPMGCGNVSQTDEGGDLRFRFGGPLRNGMIRLAHLSDAANLDLELSISRVEPLALWHRSWSEEGYVVRPIADLGSLAPQPIEASHDSRPFYRLEEGVRRRIVVRVEPGDVFLGPSPEGASYDPGRAPDLDVAIFSVTSSNEVATTTPDKVSEFETTEAHDESILKMAASDSESERMKALGVLLTRKIEGASSIVADRLRSPNAHVAILAAEALSFQSPETATPALVGAILNGPFDFNREAAMHYLTEGAARLAGPGLSVQLTGREPSVRSASVRALGRAKTHETQVLMAGFFQDKDPIVRYAAVGAANPSVDLISRRLLYAAVNDASEEVRFAALTKLLTTEGSATKEALKGVRDESPWLRVRLLNWIGKMANPSHMSALRHGIADSIPLVRSAALEAWLRFETPPTLEDLTPALKDPDPRVQLSLIQVSRRFGIVLGEETKRFLRESIDPTVRDAAKDLP